MDKESNQKCSQRNGHTQATEKGQEMNESERWTELNRIT